MHSLHHYILIGGVVFSLLSLISVLRAEERTSLSDQTVGGLMQPEPRSLALEACEAGSLALTESVLSNFDNVE